MKFLLLTVLAVLEMTMAATLRHRQLKCIKKGVYCTPYPDNCCGSTVCDADRLICCIPEGERGCEVAADCCQDSDSDLQCLDSLCAPGEVDDIDDERTCGIHGEPCNVTDPIDPADTYPNTCCGDVKYLCEPVSISEDNQDTRCCMEPGSKGCSYVYHCCGEVYGNYCDDESRCVYSDGTYPGDAEGTRECGLKGDVCVNVTECCGEDIKYACELVDGTNTTCCLKSNINGCSADADCCDGHCELALALCCIEVGNPCNNSESFECCTGYCNPDTSKCEVLSS